MKKKKDKHSARRKPTYALVSLGCPKNLVDSERMAGLLRLDGFHMVKRPEGADFVVINTCGFIGDARDESHAVIREMLDLKRRGRVGGVIVTGCLAERDKERLLAEYPEIDQLVGVFGREEISTVARRLDLVNLSPLAVSGAPEPAERMLFRPAPGQPLPDGQRLRLTRRHLAFLKIAEGCNRLCAFCSIPQMRGPYVSKPIEQVVAEAEELAADGVRELVLVAQDTTFYGIDTDRRPRLAELLSRLDQVEGLTRIRLMYLYPMYIGDELLEVIASARRIVPYLDLPLQHIDDEVLRRMRRRVTREETEALLDRLRERIPRLVLRTTLIAGFPGETQEQFDALVDFVRRRRFERLGAFAYSEEPGTAAAELDNPLSEEVKAERVRQLLDAQQEVAFQWANSQVGQRVEVMIDQPVPGQPGAYVGRTWADAPEVDPVVYVTGQNLAEGLLVPTEIVAVRGYDLIGIGD